MNTTIYWLRRAMRAASSQGFALLIRILAFSLLTAWLAGMGVYGMFAGGHPVLVVAFMVGALMSLFMAVHGDGDDKWT